MRGTATEKQHRMLKTDEGLIRACGQGEDLVQLLSPGER
jgi:hypothetical protein